MNIKKENAQLVSNSNLGAKNDDQSDLNTLICCLLRENFVSNIMNSDEEISQSDISKINIEIEFGINEEPLIDFISGENDDIQRLQDAVYIVSHPLSILEQMVIVEFLDKYIEE